MVDGDQIMAILAVSMKEKNSLRKNTLVATVMSNLGLKLAMQREGITIKETAVGDRYVLEELNAGGYSWVASSPATSSHLATPLPVTVPCLA